MASFSSGTSANRPSIESYYASPEARRIIDELATVRPEVAYLKARYIDKKASSLTRAQVARDPEWAFRYAVEVEQHIPNPVTRASVCASPKWAFFYSLEVDRCPVQATRAAACQSPEYALQYAQHVDQKWHYMTWGAVAGTPYRDEYLHKIKLPEGLWYHRLEALKEAESYFRETARAWATRLARAEGGFPYTGGTFIYSDNVEFLGLNHRCAWAGTYKQIERILERAENLQKPLAVLRIGGNFSAAKTENGVLVVHASMVSVWEMTVWSSETSDSNELARRMPI
jgi:hypothetical protein